MIDKYFISLRISIFINNSYKVLQDHFVINIINDNNKVGPQFHTIKLLINFLPVSLQQEQICVAPVNLYHDY